MSSQTASTIGSCWHSPPQWNANRSIRWRRQSCAGTTPRAYPVWGGADAARLPRLVATAFRNVPGHGAHGQVDGRRVLVGNRRLMTIEGIDPGELGRRWDELAAAGRTAVLVAVDGRAVGVLALADAPRNTAAAA